MSHLLISQKQRDQICVMLDSLKPEFGAVGSRDVEVRMRRDDVDLIISTLTAITQPASPALKLPDEKPHREGSDDTALSQVYELGIADGFNRCLREVAKLNAPHTAPIEPICATGGAEWVKCSERMPEEGGRYWCYVEEQNCLGKSHYQWNCSWNGDVWSDRALTGTVTHWMPLPAAPEEE